MKKNLVWVVGVLLTAPAVLSASNQSGPLFVSPGYPFAPRPVMPMGPGYGPAMSYGGGPQAYRGAPPVQYRPTPHYAMAPWAAIPPAMRQPYPVGVYGPPTHRPVRPRQAVSWPVRQYPAGAGWPSGAYTMPRPMPVSAPRYAPPQVTYPNRSSWQTYSPLRPTMPVPYQPRAVNRPGVGYGSYPVVPWQGVYPSGRAPLPRPVPAAMPPSSWQPMPNPWGYRQVPAPVYRPLNAGPSMPPRGVPAVAPRRAGYGPYPVPRYVNYPMPDRRFAPVPTYGPWGYRPRQPWGGPAVAAPRSWGPVYGPGWRR